MSLTSDMIFSVRDGPKLRLPTIVQELIAKLRVNPAPYKPKPFVKHNKQSSGSQSKNWRETKILSFKKIVKSDDVDYNNINSLVNKIGSSNLIKISP